MRNYRSQAGASLFEYVLLVSLIAMVALVGVQQLGNNLNNSYCGNLKGFRDSVTDVEHDVEWNGTCCVDVVTGTCVN